MAPCAECSDDFLSHLADYGQRAAADLWNKEGVEVADVRPHSVQTEGRKGRLPAKPTYAVPGSPGRMAVYAERAARGEALHHPLDFKLPEVTLHLAADPCYDEGDMAVRPQEGTEHWETPRPGTIFREREEAPHVRLFCPGGADSRST